MFNFHRDYTTQENGEVNNRQLSETYKLAIMISCGFINAVLTLLFIFSLKDAFFVKSIKKWIIHDYIQKNTKKKKRKEKVEKLDTTKSPKRKDIEKRFKSQSTNNLFFNSLFKSLPIQNKIKQRFRVSSEIVTVKVNKLIKSFSCSNVKTSKLGLVNNKNHNSTSALLKKEKEIIPKLEGSQVIKNNFIKSHLVVNKNKNVDGEKKSKNERPTYEPIYYFENGQKKNLENNKEKIKEERKEDDWQNILSFNSIKGSKKMLNDGFIDHLSEEFLSFNGDEEKILGVIINIKPINFDE